MPRTSKPAVRSSLDPSLDTSSLDRVQRNGLDGATDEELEEIASIVEGLDRLTTCPFRTLYPDKGPLRRELYWWAVAFWRAGLQHKERGLMAANQVGKTLAAAFEVTAHMTGDYPPWWPGYRFDGPTKWWIAGDTKETTREILQTVMLGPVDGVDSGDWRGMLPADRVTKHTRKSSISKAVDAFWVSHARGGSSVGQFRSYDQGRRAFQGVPLSGGVWMDEEPPEAEIPKREDGSGASGDIYSECLTRTAATNGMLLWTFTPLRGLTPFIAHQLETAVTVRNDGVEVPARSVYFPDDEANG